MENEVKRPVLSRDETAAYLGIHINTLDKCNIPRIHIGGRTLFKRETLDRYLTENEKLGINLNKRGPKCKK